jgi:predicted dehydrogenase
LLLRFASGVIGTVAVSWATPALVGWRMELSGDHGTIVTRAPGNYFPSGVGVELLTGADAQPLAREDLPSRLLASPDLEFSEDGRFPPQTPDIARVMLSLVRAIREGGSASPDFERAYHVEAVLEAARLAIYGRRWVTIEEVG